MAQPNNISVVLDDATLTEIRAAFAVLTKKLLPILKTLGEQDRKELPKIGERTMPFVEKSFEYVGRYADLVPAYLDVEAFRVDLQALKLLQTLERELAPIMDALADSIILVGSEAYQAALLFYNNLKLAIKINLGASATVYNDLSARFPGAPAKKPVK